MLSWTCRGMKKLETSSVFQDLSTHTPADLYKCSFLHRLHSSARLKAVTILCKALRVHVPKCGSRLNQDNALVRDHNPHTFKQYKGKTCLVSAYLVFHAFSCFLTYKVLPTFNTSLLVYKMNECGKARAWSFVI